MFQMMETSNFRHSLHVGWIGNKRTRTKPLSRYWRFWRVLRIDLSAVIL